MKNNQLQLLLSIILLILCEIKGNNNNVLKENNNNAQENGKLLFVWEHFRHGARDPFSQVDPITWIDFIGVQCKSQGELNSVGLRSHYLLGAATRKKYNNFLSKSFDPNEIVIISTDSNRTIMSALANVQGIYNNQTSLNLTDLQINKSVINNLNETHKIKLDKKIKELKNSYIQNGINIIPIHLFTKYSLQFKLNEIDFCPGIQKFKDEAKNQENVKKLLDDFFQYTNDTYGEYIFKFMNVSGENNSNYLWEESNLYYICNTYIADYIAGADMPHIKNSGIDMDDFYNHSLYHSFIDTYYINYGLPPTKASYVAVSPVFRTIFNYMERRMYINEHSDLKDINSSSPKYVIYSGHDSTLGSIDVFLKDVFNISYSNSEYTASQYFELWEINNKYYIKYLLNQKEIANSSYDIFKKKTLENLFPQEEVEEICLGSSNKKAKKEKNNIFKLILFITVPIAIIIFLLLILLIIIEKKREKNKNEDLLLFKHSLINQN